MKAVRISTKESGNSKSIKAIITGIIVNIAVVFIATLILSLFINLAGNLFENFAGYLLLLPLILGGYFGGLTSARINGANGLILGTLSGTITFIIMLIISFAVYNTDITYMFLLKAVSILLPSVIGGIKGVNKKEKFKI